MSGRKSPNGATATPNQVEQALIELATTLKSLNDKVDRRFESLEKELNKVNKLNKSVVKASKPVKEKDPNAPKMPLNKFMLFKNGKRAEVAARVPAELEKAEASKWINNELIRLWNDESNGYQQHYSEVSDMLKKEYKQKLETYNNNLNNLGNVRVEPDSEEEQEEQTVVSPVKKTATKKVVESNGTAESVTTTTTKKKTERSAPKKKAPVAHLTEPVDDDVNDILDNSD